MGLKGVNFNCPDCGTKNPATKKNVVFYIFTRQPMYNMVEFHCVCGSVYKIFKLNQFIETTNLLKWHTITKEYADKKTIKMFAKIFFRDELEVEQESMINYFSKVLEDITEVSDIDWGE